MRRPILPILGFAVLCGLTACRSGSGLRPGSRMAKSGEADDAARFLAGLPGRGTSPFKIYESDPAWREHSRRLDAMFADFRDRRAPQMREFARSELSRREDLACPVFYPFSGADALTLLTFFPGRKTYVMAALEPPGHVPEATELSPEALPRLLPPLASTLESLLHKSFFVTREMDRQLRGQATDGSWRARVTSSPGTSTSLSTARAGPRAASRTCAAPWEGETGASGWNCAIRRPPERPSCIISR